LCEFGWKKGASPAWKCKGCGKDPEDKTGIKKAVWCVDCKKRLCATCAYNLHAPGTGADSHSLEVIKFGQGKESIRIITPLLGELIIVLGLIYLFMYGSLLQENYLTSQVTCPFVSRARTFIASTDANLFYVYKDTFFSWCDYEDSFFRFLLDAWVRTIVTSTDNTVLVIQTLPKAALFNIVAMYVIAPFISIVFAVGMNCFSKLEEFLPSIVPEESMPKSNDMLRFIEKEVVPLLGFLDYFSVGGSFPPQTERRTRDSQDYLDMIRYERNRLTRKVSFHFNDSLNTLQNLLQSLLITTMVLRLMDIWFGLLWPLRIICRFLFSPTVQLHQTWFIPSGTIPWTRMIISESRLWTTSTNIGKVLAYSLLGISNASQKVIVSLAAFGGVAGMAVFFYLAYLIMMQRRDSSATWARKTKEAEEKAVGGDINHVVTELDFGQQMGMIRRAI
jgi:hypothetical protein